MGNSGGRSGGLSLRSKKTCGFPNPFTGSRPHLIKQKRHTQGMSFLLVDDQGLEAGYHSQNEVKISKKYAKSAHFESYAPIMPQNAPTKNPNKNPEN